MIDQVEVNRANLRARRRRPGESIQDLHVDLARLGTKAYPRDVGSPMYVELMRDRFLEALNDVNLHMEVWKCKPKTIEEAASFATEYESHVQHLQVSNKLLADDQATTISAKPTVKAVGRDDCSSATLDI
jgi:hypothetical protein